ncbi:MAG: sensor histidine kinase, partial [Vicinamibacteria bacterium]
MTRIEPLAEARGAAGRVCQLLAEQDEALARRTDRLFAPLLVLQWVVTAAVAVVGARPDAGVILAVGAAVALPAAALAWRRAGAPSTRVAVALAQSAASALLIHASGGRIEAHFHIFGSLAFLSFYRDWRLLALAMAVATVDHALRGVWLPWSVFGAHHASYWRVVEHAAWMLFETAILSVAIRQSRAEMREIAERRASLERSHAEVERQVHERTAEIEAARDKAIEAAGLKAAFLANMSHEIRTPLNAVIGMTGLLLDTTLSREQREYASVARASGESLLGIINDILDLSKIEAGKLLLEPAECDPRDLVEGVLDLVAEAAHTKGVELASFVDSGVPAGVVTDARRVRQVLLNLVSNAVKFTDRGDVSVRVALMEGGGADGPTVLAFYVRDTGVGIAPEFLPHVFDRFRQADASTTRTFGGLGLGLAIVRHIVELHGGAVAAHSDGPGQGARFVVSLPAPVADAHPATAAVDG